MRFRPLPSPTIRANCSSGKVPHPNERTAQQAADHSAQARGIELTVYRCHECLQWHLTSKAE